MAPLIVQTVTWGLALIAGLVGLTPAFAAPVEALRFSLAVMFVFTAVSHFAPGTRRDMLAMVPPGLPMPGVLLTITGLLELAGAVGLMLPQWSRWAAFALAALLVAMFPANIHAARAQVMLAGRRTMSLIPRSLLQVFWIACLAWVAMTRAG